MQSSWARVDQYLGDLLASEDAHLQAILATNRKMGLPPIDVPPLLGQFLGLTVRMIGARRVLEVGTLGGYSTLWIARALPADGLVVSLEIDPNRAATARASLAAAEVSDRVEILEGPAADTMRRLHAESATPFDLCFLDADKRSLPEYLELSLHLAHPGSVIIADNVVRDGHIVDSKHPDEDVQGVRRFLEMLSADPRLTSTAIPTVGARGYDGFSLAIVSSL